MFQYIQNNQQTRQQERESILITIGGMIGAGKTTITNLLTEELGYKAYYENVEGNTILPLFYTSSPEEQARKRYPFLLQLEFLNSRYSTIKEALQSNQDIIMDRSIYEDWYFAYTNEQIGNISELEFGLYEKLLNNMLEEINTLPKKAPDLMIYLKISFNKTLERIGKRGREFEQDKNLYDYYYTLWKDYDNWVMNHYDQSNVLIIDMDEIDVENNDDHKALVVDAVLNAYNALKEQEGKTLNK